MNDLADTAAELVDLVGRIMMTHAFPPECVMGVLGIDRPEAERVIGLGRLSVPLEPDQRERLSIFASILIRLELRFHHDGPAIRHALEARSDALGGAAPIDLLAGSLKDLHDLRRSVETMEGPKIRWYRIGH